MKCPKCHNANMNLKEIADGLKVSECEQCSGIWIKASNYWTWLKLHGTPLPEKDISEGLKLNVKESSEIKICPDCQHFLTRRLVGHGLNFHVDRCATCGGIWLDKNEWDMLASRNLHDEIHMIFSTQWQDELKKQKQSDFFEEKMCEVLGQKEYDLVKSFYGKISDSPHKNAILAYLSRD